MMRCPACGAHNPDGASWCSQCYTAFGGPPGRAGEPGTGPAGEADRAPAPDVTDAPPPVTPGAPGGARREVGNGRDVREVDGNVEWRCRACDGWSPLLASTCLTCASPRQGFGDPATPSHRELSPATALAVSVAVPGAGHLLAGRIGSGIARAVLGWSWLLVGVWLLVAARAAGRGSLPALPLLLGAAAVWIGTLVDVHRLAIPRARELLTPRVLAVLTSVVVLGLLIGLFSLVG